MPRLRAGTCLLCCVGAATLSACTAGQEEYQREANDVCLDLTEQLTSLPPPSTVPLDPVEAGANQELAEYERRVSSLVTKALKELREIDPPESHSRRYSEWLDTIAARRLPHDRMQEAYEDIRASLASGRSPAAAERALVAANRQLIRLRQASSAIARELQLTACVDI